MTVEEVKKQPDAIDEAPAQPKADAGIEAAPELTAGSTNSVVAMRDVRGPGSDSKNTAESVVVNLLERLKKEGAVRGLSEVINESGKPMLASNPSTTTEASVVSIQKALEGGNSKVLREQLEGKSKEQLQQIQVLFKEKFGINGKGLQDRLSEKFSGSELAEVNALIRGENDDASHIFTQLIKSKESREADEYQLPDRNAENKIIDTIKSKNSKELEALDTIFRDRYKMSLRDALLKDENLSESTKKVLEVYLKGADKRDSADLTKLADIATDNKDLELFKSIFADGALGPEMRKQYLENGGEKKIEKAFGAWLWGESLEKRQALDYVKGGKLAADTAVDLNRSWIGDNEKAIELTLSRLTPEERKSYLEGKRLSKGSTSDLTESQKQSLEYYNKLHSSLERAAGYNLGIGSENAKAREMARWEDMIATKGGSVLSRLTEHFGSVYNDSPAKALETIEKMSSEDAQKLKSDPEYRKQIDDLIARHYTESKDRERFRDLLDRKAEAKSPDDATIPVLDRIKDKSGIFKTDTTDLLSSIEKMSSDERKKYKEDPEYRKQVDRAIESATWSPHARAAVRAVLEDVAKGQEPKIGIIAKLHAHARDYIGDTGKVVTDVEKSFREEPGLFEKISNPKTPEDRRIAEEFSKTLRDALGTKQFEKYGTKLIEKGEVSVEDKLEIHNKTNFDRFTDKTLIAGSILAPVLSPVLLGMLAGKSEGDKQGFFRALETASAGELAKIAQDPQRLLGFLSKEEQTIAQAIALQGGKAKPEDKLRIAFLAGDTDRAKEIIAGLPDSAREEFKKSYSTKYGADALSDARQYFTGEDQKFALRALRSGPVDAAEALRRAQEDRPEESAGKWFVDKLWDGTGHQAVDDYHQLARIITEAARENKTIAPEQLKEFDERLQEALKLYRESKTAAADAVVDSAIVVVGIGGAAFTGGVSLSLLATTGLGGAAFKIAVKSSLEGKDYDWSAGNVLKDGTTGAIQSAASFFGGAQLAILKRLGEGSAVRAASMIVTHSEKLVESGAKGLIKEGAGQALQNGLFLRLAAAIGNGEREITAASIRTLAKTIALSAEAAPELESLIVKGLSEAIKHESSTLLKAIGREALLNAQSTGAGGTFNGLVEGLHDVDSRKTILENIGTVLSKAAEQTILNSTIAGLATPVVKGVTKTLGEAPDAVKRAYKKGEEFFDAQPVPRNAGSAGAIDKASKASVPDEKTQIIQDYLRQKREDKLVLGSDGIPTKWPPRLRESGPVPEVPPGYIRLYRGVKMQEGAQKEFLPSATAKERKRWGDLASIPEEKRTLDQVKEMISLQPKMEAYDSHFYTNALGTAEKHAGDRGVVIYIDVPSESAKQWHAIGGNIGREAQGADGATFRVPDTVHHNNARVFPGNPTQQQTDNARTLARKGSNRDLPETQAHMRDSMPGNSVKSRIETKNASPELVSEVQRAVDDLPPSLRRLVGEGGQYQIVIARDIDELGERYGGRTQPLAGGHPGETGANRKAFIDYDSKKIFLIENYDQAIADDTGKIIGHSAKKLKATEVQDIISHELSHGLDDSVAGRFSNSDKFKRAVVEDWAQISRLMKEGKLSPEDQEFLGYFMARNGYMLQRWGISDIGRHQHLGQGDMSHLARRGAHETSRREIFAEGVNSILGNSPESRQMLRFFPRATSAIREGFADIGLPHSSRPIDMSAPLEPQLRAAGFKKFDNGNGEQTFSNNATGTNFYLDKHGKIEEVGVRGDNRLSNTSSSFQYNADGRINSIHHSQTVSLDGSAASLRTQVSKVERIGDSNNWKLTKPDGSVEEVKGVEFTVDPQGKLTRFASHDRGTPVDEINTGIEARGLKPPSLDGARTNVLGQVHRTGEIRFGNSRFELQGDKVVIGRAGGNADIQIADGFISNSHVTIRRKGDKFYISDNGSSNGTTLNGVPLRGEKEIRTGDRIVLGRQENEVRFSTLLRLDEMSKDNPLRTVEGPIGSRAASQSNLYSSAHEIDEKLLDGWSMAGAGGRFNTDGTYRTPLKVFRPAIVIDRQNDPYLAAAIREAKQRFGHLEPRARAVELARWTKQILEGKATGRQLDDWYSAFNAATAGRRIYLGEFIRQQKGVCSQQALLLKVIADEFPDMKVKLVRGSSAGTDLEYNHAWTEFDFGTGKPLIFDPRQRILGDSYTQIKHIPGQRFEEERERAGSIWGRLRSWLG